MARLIRPRIKSVLRVAILIGSRRRKRRLQDRTKMIEVHKPEFDNEMVVDRERFVLMEYPVEVRFTHEGYDRVEVRHYARVSYRTWRDVQKKITDDQFNHLLFEAQIT